MRYSIEIFQEKGGWTVEICEYAGDSESGQLIFQRKGIRDKWAALATVRSNVHCLHKKARAIR
jgi:hypothetical protein